jgi:4-coumarate--CoA ligase
MSVQDPFNHTDDLSSPDLVSWTFGNHDYDQDKKIYVHADDPEQSVSASQARRIVKELVAGFQAKGLEPGDCVCVYAYSNVRQAFPSIVAIHDGHN